MLVSLHATFVCFSVPDLFASAMTLMVFTAPTFAIVAVMASSFTAVSSAMAASAATSASLGIEYLLYLLVGYVVTFYDLAHEVEVHSCERVVEVDGYFVIADGGNETLEASAFFVLEWDDGIDLDMLIVKFAVNGEDILI